MIPAFLRPEAILYASIEIITAPRVVCAWCPDFDPTDVSNQTASHGICDACRAKVDVELVARGGAR